MTMNKSNPKSSGLYRKHLLCVAVLASFSLPLQAGSLMTPTQIEKPQLASKNIVIKLGYSQSALGDSLASKFKMQTVDNKVQSKQAIAAKVAAASVLLVNSKDFYGSDEHLNAYLAEAMKQRKLMVFENTDESEAIFTTLPGMVKGDLVLFQPRDHEDGDSITVYGGTSILITEDHSSAASKNGKSLNQLQIEEMSAQSAQFTPDPESFNMMNEPVTIKDTKLSQMQGDELAQALTTVTNKIIGLVRTSSNTDQSKTQIASAGGGSAGYDCPTAAKNEQLCWVANVQESTYYYDNADAKLNVNYSYSLGQYRTDQGTSIAVSPYSIVSPNMTSNTVDLKAYYLLSVTSSVYPSQTDGMIVTSRFPTNNNGVTHVTSTSGMTYGIDVGGTAEGPSLNGMIAFDSSIAKRTELQDWETDTWSNGTFVSWKFMLNKYKTIQDFVEEIWWGKSKLRDLPKMSAYGFDPITEAVWRGSKDVSGWFKADIMTRMVIQKMWFTTNYKFGTYWYVNTDTKNLYLEHSKVDFNNGWLKDI
jgi:hypothetical protein